MLKILRELIAKKLVVSISSFAFALFGALYSLTLENQYTSRAIVKVTDEINASSANSISFSGLPNFGAQNLLGGDDAVDYAVEVLSSDVLMKKVIEDSEILLHLLASKSINVVDRSINIDNKIYDQTTGLWLGKYNENISNAPSVHDVQKTLNGLLFIEKNPSSGFIHLSFQHVSPEFSSFFIKKLVNEANQITRKKSLIKSERTIAYLESELAKTTENVIIEAISMQIEENLRRQTFAYISDDFLVEYIDEPVIPTIKSYPSRAIIVIISFILGFLLSASYVLRNKFLYK